jgi:hypothetical protein
MVNNTTNVKKTKTNKQTPLASNHYTQKEPTAYGIGNLCPGLGCRFHWRK